MQKKGPWEIKSSKVVYQNPWMTVREDAVIRPDGNDGIVGVVEMKSGVSILPIDTEGNVYLIKEYGYAVEGDSILTISGGIDGKEERLHAAKRELLEEAGIVANEWTELGYINPFTALVASQNYLFIAKDLSFTSSHPEGTEDLKLIKLPFQKALAMIDTGEITHGGSVALLLKAKNLIQAVGRN